MKKILYVTILFVIHWSANSQSDYFVYHSKINDAEIAYFMNNKPNECLALYDEVFDCYDFVFLKDLLNAAQIAIFNNKNYEKYLMRSFEFGLKIDDLKMFPLFSSVYIQYKNNKKIKKIFEEARLRYLQKIDFEYLDYIYSLAINDQVDKYKKGYEKRIDIVFQRLINVIKSKGFPSEKLLGITDTAIFAERSLKKLDINARARKYKVAKYFFYGKNRLHFDVSMPILLHHKCSSALYYDVFLKEIKLGNMHPQDLAFISDFNSQFLDKLPSYCDNLKFEGLYSFSPVTGDLTNRKDIERANKLRKKLYMIPYDVVLKKREFVEKYNFVLNFGFNGSARE
ncbi:hypothetical protein [Flavobacterium aurantiibacter]|uniref:Uncharacterized protein n=1 Tax=Flavobacterium aurantiibacter TaxID=2023067 RepID=A0A256AEV8_9FLAO|nr:hypothetical protein [Flavobacterium aurantiibacter]OYQ52203.1 hypothetical protein CHX27_00095 [Flavobacterium aurantiibacter]